MTSFEKEDFGNIENVTKAEIVIYIKDIVAQ